MSAWMVRAGRGGIYSEGWLDEGRIVIWWKLGGLNPKGSDRETIKQAYSSQYTDAKPQEIAMAGGQAYRFANEMEVGDSIVMYSPQSRIYHIGRITSECLVGSNTDKGAEHTRTVEWENAAPRDLLSSQAKNSLGSIATLFSVSDSTMQELVKVTENPLSAKEDPEIAEEMISEIRYATAEDGIERIKDKIMSLSWDEMELLVAGLLRAMGYKTSMTRKGSDGGRDIIASPDGLGLESPCIVVEVKHRKDSMGAPDIRAFIGGLRSMESGLYVSSGGFTKEAQYEADRATMPLRILDLDRFARLLVDNFEGLDTETKALLPLVRIYWPV